MPAIPGDTLPCCTSDTCRTQGSYSLLQLENQIWSKALRTPLSSCFFYLELVPNTEGLSMGTLDCERSYRLISPHPRFPTIYHGEVHRNEIALSVP